MHRDANPANPKGCGGSIPPPSATWIMQYVRIGLQCNGQRFEFSKQRHGDHVDRRIVPRQGGDPFINLDTQKNLHTITRELHS